MIIALRPTTNHFLQLPSLRFWLQMAASFLSQSSFMGSGVASGGPDELDQAAAVVDQSIMADKNYVDLSDLLQVPKHSKCEQNVKSIRMIITFEYSGSTVLVKHWLCFKSLVINDDDGQKGWVINYNDRSSCIIPFGLRNFPSTEFCFRGCLPKSCWFQLVQHPVVCLTLIIRVLQILKSACHPSRN